MNENTNRENPIHKSSYTKNDIPWHIRKDIFMLSQVQSTLFETIFIAQLKVKPYAFLQ